MQINDVDYYCAESESVFRFSLQNGLVTSQCEIAQYMYLFYINSIGIMDFTPVY